MNWKPISLAFMAAITLQSAALAQVHVGVVPTSCGKEARASLVSVSRTNQILLVVSGLDANAAAEMKGFVSHTVDSFSFDTSFSSFGLLGVDPHLELVAEVLDPFGSITQGDHHFSIVRVSADNAHHTKLSNGYTRCSFSGEQLSEFKDVVDVWVNCGGPNLTEHPPGTNHIFVTNFVINNHTILNYLGTSDNSACLIPNQL